MMRLSPEWEGERLPLLKLVLAGWLLEGL